MKVRIVDILAIVVGFASGIGLAFGIAFLLQGCVPLQDLHQVAHVAEQVDSMLHVIDGPTDWAGIIEKVGYSVAGIAALIGGGEAVRRKMKKAPKKRKKNV